MGRLGAGGMGDVYLGRTPGGRPAAVKVISDRLRDDPQALNRFRREVDTLRTVHSAYTAALIDAEVTTPPYWMATEYIPGPTLYDAVMKTGPLPLELCRAVLAALAEGLADIHVHGVLHRDIKPQNVILSGTGPQLIDFGIARGAEPSDLTQANVTIGTPGFIAPETITQSETGPAADVFALGATLAYALTGRPPYGEGSMITVSYRTVHEEVDLRGVPAEMSELITACTHRDPALRPDPQRIVELCQSRIDLVQHPAYQQAAAAAAASPAGVPTPPPTPPAATAHIASPAVADAATMPGTRLTPPPATALDTTGPAGEAAPAAPRSAWRGRRRLWLIPGAVVTAGALAAALFVLQDSGGGAEAKADGPSAPRGADRSASADAGASEPAQDAGETGSDTPEAVPPESLVVPAPHTLRIGEFLRSARAKLILQKDGNLVLYDENGEARWSSGVFGSDFSTVFQEDGNLVVYSADAEAVWASNTGGAEGSVLELRADGNVVITKDGQDVWQTDTAH
ncbi:protein kinase [Streptomyces sp. NPDC091212]|uniref:protein kinase domain-containing protein n=1 Tax=Streptomyces sp. NPDC091212 TaxID=3155191 RepID=UPI003419374B